MWSSIAQSSSLSSWYATPQGAFALDREKSLLQKLLSPWPRRGHSLLEVGCADGQFLELFWQSGFDVTGLDRHSPLLAQARQRLGCRVDIQVGAADALPYDDNAFDYVALMAPLPAARTALVDAMAEGEEAPGVSPARDILREAVRVAAKGVMLRCWNPCSLAGLWRQRWLCPARAADQPAAPGNRPGNRPDSRPGPAADKPALWLGWRDYCALLRALAPDSTLRTRSTLLGPPPTWKEHSLLRRLNCQEVPLPLGAVFFLRLTLGPRPPFTALPLRIPSLGIKNTAPEPILERTVPPTLSIPCHRGSAAAKDAHSSADAR